MNINQKCVNNLRVIGCQMIEEAGSGHPGIVLGAMPILFEIYANQLNTVPNDASNILRDRFVLSAGHGSAMLYSVLHAFGYNYSLQDLQSFRRIGSPCHGHPERDVKRGVEVTTGPLGQGVANAVGLAIAERHLAARFNKPDAKLIDNYTYALVGDGCLMEGVANEALSLAGTLELNKLIVLYDYNQITIDGRIDITFLQNTRQVFEGYGFNVLLVHDGNNLVQINKAISKAKKSKLPTLIIVNTVIGYGSALQDTSAAHGNPLGAERMQQLKQNLGIDANGIGLLPDVAEHLQILQKRFIGIEKQFENRATNYKIKYPKEYEEFLNLDNQDINSLLKSLESLKLKDEKFATRDLGGLVLNQLAENCNSIIGGSADVGASTKAVINNGGQFLKNNPLGRNIMFGVREHAMAAICNGITSYGKLTPFASTFLVFSDYLTPALRVGALSGLRTPYIFTHDSIGVGEDGPTHQPIEQLATLRATPNVYSFRPANLEETKAAYAYAFSAQAPTTINLSRQKLLNFKSNAKDALMGAYIVAKENKKLDAILVATGSEVEIALEAKAELAKKGVDIRVVSMPCMELFEEQSDAYKNKILPKTQNKRVVVEAGSTFGWHKYATDGGVVVGINTFGKGGNYQDVYKHFGITADKIVENILSLLKRK